MNIFILFFSYLKLCIIIGSGHILISDTFNIAAVYAIMLLMWTMAIHSFQHFSFHVLQTLWGLKSALKIITYFNQSVRTSGDLTQKISSMKVRFSMASIEVIEQTQAHKIS